MTKSTNKAKCPNCVNVIYDATDPAFGRSPKPGDFTICLKCHDISRFAENGTFRPITESDIDELPLDGIARWQQLIPEIKSLSEGDLKDTGPLGVTVKL